MTARSRGIVVAVVLVLVIAAVAFFSSRNRASRYDRRIKSHHIPEPG